MTLALPGKVAEAYKTWREMGSPRNLNDISKHFNKSERTMRRWLRQYAVDIGITSKDALAARQGFSPEHDMVHTVPAPFVVKGTSTLYKDGVAKIQWVKTKLDEKQVEEAIKSAVEALTEGSRGEYDPLPPPEVGNEKLCNLFTFTDCHVGMLTWHKETGDDWDLKIAERTLCAAFDHLVNSSATADTAIILQLGDFMHFDGLDAVTPLHRNQLDADGRFSKVVAVAVRVLRYIIDGALKRHKFVHVVMAEGNHDIASSVWLRHLFALLYEREPRVAVNDSETPYYVYQHGRVLLGFHHGHIKKSEGLPSLFAAEHRKKWGETDKCYIHTGHRHHVEEKEFPGAKVIQHATITGRDSYAARGGWVSEREMTSITYHADFGQVARNTVTPEMLSVDTGGGR